MSTSPHTTNTTPSGIAGGWSDWNFNLTQEAIQVFSAIHLIGVDYTAIAFATQVLAGTNYAFLCEAQPLIADQLVDPVVMHVYQSLSGELTVTNIERLGPTSYAQFGGWSTWSFSVNPDAQAVFDEATQNWIGARYQALAYFSQVVAGRNYCFLCEGTLSTLGQTTTAVLIYISQPLQGKPSITEIQSIRP